MLCHYPVKNSKASSCIGGWSLPLFGHFFLTLTCSWWQLSEQRAIVTQSFFGGWYSIVTSNVLKGRPSPIKLKLTLGFNNKLPLGIFGWGRVCYSFYHPACLQTADFIPFLAWPLLSSLSAVYQQHTHSILREEIWVLTKRMITNTYFILGLRKSNPCISIWSTCGPWVISGKGLQFIVQRDRLGSPGATGTNVDNVGHTETRCTDTRMCPSWGVKYIKIEKSTWEACGEGGRFWVNI